MSQTVLTATKEDLVTTINPREALLLHLKGRTARIPDLKPVLAGWRGISSRHMSPFVEPLREKVNARLRGFNFDKAKRRRLEASDFASFTALWWPDATLERLEILAYLVIWLFTWDDEIDEPTGAFSTDFAGAQAYRERTLRFVGHCLGLNDTSSSSSGEDKHEGALRPQNEIVQSFDVIGAALRASYNWSQCQRFHDEMARFMAASEDEQAGRLTGHIPSLDEYWRFRLGTSAVYIGSAAGEYSISSCIPDTLMRSDAAMQAIWDETNVIISITNDLLSLRKEMQLDCIDSIVPLLFASTGDVQRAISEAVGSLRAARERFDKAAEELMARRYEDEEIRSQVEQFIEVQRSNCVGNLVWSLETLRYKMGELTSEDGGQTFIL